jgi:hypothetical protein
MKLFLSFLALLLEYQFVFARSATIVLTPEAPRFARVWIVSDEKSQLTGVWLSFGPRSPDKPLPFVEVELRKQTAVQFRSPLAPWPGASLISGSGRPLFPAALSGFDYESLKKDGLYYFVAPSAFVYSAGICLSWEDPAQAVVGMRFWINLSDWKEQSQPRK